MSYAVLQFVVMLLSNTEALFNWCQSKAAFYQYKKQAAHFLP